LSKQCRIKCFPFENYSSESNFYYKGSDFMMMRRKQMNSRTMGIAAGIIGIGAAAAMLMKRSRQM
jgi:hypothetical protein